MPEAIASRVRTGGKVVTYVSLRDHIIRSRALLSQEEREKIANLVSCLMTAVRIIRRQVAVAGLVDLLGRTGHKNIHGEEVACLDDFAQSQIRDRMGRSGLLCVMASEEEENIIPIPDSLPMDKYVLTFDPLDGSSNIDCNNSIGTIFSVHRKVTLGEKGTKEDCLQCGREQVAAGYVIYGPRTILVYSIGAGVHGFTFDLERDRFLLSHPDIRVPQLGGFYSINEGNEASFDEGTREYLRYVKTPDKATGRPYKARYVGSLVADVHRTLLKGGIFIYPAAPKPKLRLLCECSPIAFIMEQAGGKASTGDERILDIQPRGLHGRVPLVVGSTPDVELYENFFRQNR